MKLIGAFDRSRVSTLEPRVNSVLIMVTSDSAEYPEIKGTWKATLKLKFDDVEGREAEMDDKDYAMQEIHAQHILNFVIEHIDKDIFVSCDAGMSRSPGILVALEQIFNARNVSERYLYHNKFVKNKIRDVWFKSIWRG